ncbi:MAG TPA: hypothetical protein VEA41_06320 [Salinarimonas sp.]|nr:hypothetical protein [Salinarimonas sp.]
MNAEQVLKRALTEASEYGSNFPTSHALLYRRISSRQMQLFAEAASINADWAGACFTMDLVGGNGNLTDTFEGESAGINGIARISRITVENPGSSAWAAGREVDLVSSDDVDSGAPPRAFFRGYSLFQVGTDLNGVSSLKVHYSRRPAVVDGPADEIELPEPHTECLVWDLAMILLARASTIDPERKKAGNAFFTMMRDEAEEQFKTYVREYVALMARHAGRG